MPISQKYAIALVMLFVSKAIFYLNISNMQEKRYLM